MKNTFCLKNTFLTYSLVAILFAFGASVATADDAAVRTEGVVNYVSGGVGTESIDQLSAIAGQFNLKLVFALATGDYLSNVRVVITNNKGETLLDTHSDGPWFLAKLPVGTYRIAATVDGKELQRKVTVSANRLSTVDFRWPVR